jgi:putative transposase
VFIKIAGKTHYLWPAGDQHGDVPDILLTARRDAAAATRFFRNLVKGGEYAPRVLITDNLASYGPARRRLMPRGARSIGTTGPKTLINPPGTASGRRAGCTQRAGQWLLSVFTGIPSYSRPRRHLLSAQTYRREMDTRFATRNETVGLPTAA